MGAAAAPALSVTRLALRNFRNYPSLLVCPPPGIVVLTGENGAGKTNVLEAISMLSPGRGLRRAAVRELDRDRLLAWHVSADLGGAIEPVRIETWRPPELDRRVASVEGVGVARQAKLAQHVGLAWLTPAQDRLLQDPPSARRRFLDRLVLTSAPEHAARTSAYERALRERSTLLRGGGRDRVWLDVIERRMSEAGVAIAAARVETVAALNAQLDRLDTPFPRPVLEVVGSCERALAEAPALEVEEQMMADLRLARAGDAQAGGASCGPHRSDLDLIDAETGSPAQSCSTGRQKSLLVSIVLAQALLRRDRLGAFPILLLDEIAAHLDARRRDALFVFLAGLGIQAWLSGTDAHAFHALAGRATFFLVNDGRLTAYD
jgi:DNA replication and repair protein RecF